MNTSINIKNYTHYPKVAHWHQLELSEASTEQTGYHA